MPPAASSRNRGAPKGLAVPPMALFPAVMVALVVFADAGSRWLGFHTPPAAAAPNPRLALQPAWSWVVANHGHFASHFLFPSVVGLTSFVLTCLYFTWKDVVQDRTTKTYPQVFPTKRELLVASVPQVLIYIGLNSLSWVVFDWRVPLPECAPTVPRLAWEMFVCILGGDFLIYVEHRVMHHIPYLRNHIHSVHHQYEYVFAWAGGWVHPLEDLAAIACQMTFPVLVLHCHPLSLWAFVFVWVAFLMEEHSGHHVWWSLDVLLPGKLGGGAAVHDIHHVRPLKNFGFLLSVWDLMFDTFEEPKGYPYLHAPPREPSLPPLDPAALRKHAPLLSRAPVVGHPLGAVSVLALLALQHRLEGGSAALLADGFTQLPTGMEFTRGLHDKKTV